MRAAIITLHRVFNYGSVFQTYATQKILEDLNYKVEVIDYITEQRTNKRLFLGVPNFIKKDIYHQSKYLCMKMISVLWKKKSFGGFLKRHVHLTQKKYITVKNIENNVPMADIYIVGSDQVWNSTYNEGIDRGFFLDFVHNTKKIAFASSFGKEKLEEWEVAETKKYLSDFKKISVREMQGLKILSDMGLDGECIIDPTLQIKKEVWLSLASRRLVKEKYLLLMLLYNEDNGATEYARKVADKNGLLLVKLSWELIKPSKIDKLMTHRKPEDFLSLFNYADFIVTNSFHGLAFSLNFNKEFVVFPRNEYNSRIESLLELVGLSERMIQKTGYNPLKKIDYNKVNNTLGIERQKARKFLEEALHVE